MKRQVRRARIRGIIGLGLLISLLLAYVIGPRFSEPAKIRSAAATTLTSKSALDIRVANLTTRASNMAEANRQMDTYNRRFPATTAAIDLEAAINAAANKVGLGSGSIQLVRPDAPTPVLINPTVAYDANQTGNTPAAATPAPTASASAANPAPSASASPNAAAAAATTDLWEMPVTVQFSANNYSIIVKFVNALYSMSRLMVVDHVTVKPAGSGYNVEVVGRVFILKAGSTGK